MSRLNFIALLGIALGCQQQLPPPEPAVCRSYGDTHPLVLRFLFFNDPAPTEIYTRVPGVPSRGCDHQDDSARPHTVCYYGLQTTESYHPNELVMAAEADVVLGRGEHTPRVCYASLENINGTYNGWPVSITGVDTNEGCALRIQLPTNNH